MIYKGFEIVDTTPQSSRMFGGEWGAMLQRREIVNPKTGETIETTEQLRTDREAKNYINKNLLGGEA